MIGDIVLHLSDVIIYEESCQTIIAKVKWTFKTNLKTS